MIIQPLLTTINHHDFPVRFLLNFSAQLRSVLQNSGPGEQIAQHRNTFGHGKELQRGQGTWHPQSESGVASVRKWGLTWCKELQKLGCMILIAVVNGVYVPTHDAYNWGKVGGHSL